MSTPRRPFFKRLREYLRPRPQLIPLSAEEILAAGTGRGVVEKFNDLYYTSGVSQELNWRGHRMIKNPCDLWMVLEILQRLRPAVIIEAGTFHGGSARFYTEMAKLFEIPCRVITIDVDPRWSVDPASLGITSLRASSTDPSTVAQVREMAERFTAETPGPVMVMLDSDHSEAHVRSEIELYAPMVSVGSYLIVEDTNVNGHPSDPGHGPGPWEAVEKFLEADPGFVVDMDCQRFLLTFNPRGWLRRVS